MSVNRMRRNINRELTLLNEKRKLVSVFDEANSSPAYKSHREYVRNLFHRWQASIIQSLPCLSLRFLRRKLTTKVQKWEARAFSRK